MNLRTGLAVAVVVIGLGVSSAAMAHARDRNDGHAQLQRASWRPDEHDRKAYGALPPGQSKSESKMWRKEHKSEAKGHQKEMKARQHEARQYRHHSHELVVHKQPKPPYNAQKKGGINGMVQAAKANKEHRREAEHH